MAQYIPQWWSIASAKAAEIRRWLSDHENPKLAVTQRVINNYTAMQLLVSGRDTPCAEDMIGSLRVLIEFGADLNYIPPKDSGLSQSSVLVLAARSAPRPVIEFLIDNGAKWNFNGETEASVAACSYVNAPVILHKLVGVPEEDPPFVFEHEEYPADYTHDLTSPRLAWLNYIPDNEVKSKLIALLQKRKVIYFQSNAPSSSAERVFNTEVIFGLPVTAQDDENSEKRLLFASNPAINLLRNEVHCSLKYSSMTATNGQQDFKFELSLPVNRDLCQHRAAYYVNEYIDPQVSHIGFKAFSAQVNKMFDIPTEYSYAVILMLLLHVNDPTLVVMSSTRWEVLRPVILQSIAAPHWLDDIARAWARYDSSKEKSTTFGRRLQVYAQE
jgi:hypothetical protein